MGALSASPLIDSPQTLLGLTRDAYEAALGSDEVISVTDADWYRSNLCIQRTTCCVSCVDQGKQALEDKLKELELNLEDLHVQKEIRNKLVKWFRQNSTLTLKEIGHVLGDLSESTVSKILKANSK